MKSELHSIQICGWDISACFMKNIAAGNPVRKSFSVLDVCDFHEDLFVITVRGASLLDSNGKKQLLLIDRGH